MGGGRVEDENVKRTEKVEFERSKQEADSRNDDLEVSRERKGT
jgi:hypothetical protein